MLQVSKWEMKSGASRDEFGVAALNFCKNAKSNSGVGDAKFYWQNPNVVAIIVEHDGSWGPNVEPSGQTMKAFFDLADLSTCTMDEPWIEAGLGHKRTQKISS